MARHLVISFDDNEEAEQFVEALKIEGAVFFQDATQHFKNVNPEKVRLIGLFAKPTKFCDCVHTSEAKTVRSQKFGWYIHWPGCGKPISGHYQSALKNLLNPPGTDARSLGIFLGVREGVARWPEPGSSQKTTK